MTWMRPIRDEVDIFLADWVLGRVTPQEAVKRALRALDEGCEHQSVAVVAGSRATTRSEIEAQLPRFLATLDRQLPGPEDALKVLADDCAYRIADGTLDPMRGAEVMFDLWANEHESVELMTQIRPIVDLAYDEDPAVRDSAVKRDAIRAEAHRFIKGGGLRLPL